MASALHSLSLEETAEFRDENGSPVDARAWHTWRAADIHRQQHKCDFHRGRRKRAKSIRISKGRCRSRVHLGSILGASWEGGGCKRARSYKRRTVKNF
jgi:hypothetical protein